jgi:hypothetical protein
MTVRAENEGKRTEQGALILPRMAIDGGYRFTCCDCLLTHRLDFAISEQHGLEMRVYGDQAKTDELRDEWFEATT